MAWLTDWSKRIKLTIPSTNIDATLTNFPMAVTLASGTNTEAVFDELNTVVSGTVPVNTVLLLHMDDVDLTDSGPSNHIPTIGGVIRSSDQSKFGGYSAYFNNAYISFASHADFALGTEPFTLEFWIRPSTVTADDGVFGIGTYDNFSMYITGSQLRMFWKSGSYDLIKTVSTYTWYHVAICRDGASLKVFVDGTIEYDGTKSAGDSVTQGIFYVGYYYSGSYIYSGYIDELLLVKDTALYDSNFNTSTEPYYETYIDYHNKKMTITTDDGVTQCYVETERWNYDNGEANLWTKVPVIHNDEDTILYLYYDVTQNDNATYVGDTGSTPAQNVWDDNFVGVWHMSQDPSGGTDAILDSTSDGNHGTSGGYDAENLALFKTSAQSSGADPSSNAVDGDTGTYQSTNNNAGEWWKVDLGSEYNISSIQMIKRPALGDRPHYYYIQTAGDYAFTTNVVNIITESNENSIDITWDTGDFGTVTARYFRVLCYDHGQYMNMIEFRVYVELSGVADGKIGKAISFDANDDRVTPANEYGDDPTDLLCVEAIFRTNNTTLTQVVVGRYQGVAPSGYYGWILWHHASHNKIQWRTNESQVTDTDLASNNLIVANTWYYVAATKDVGDPAPMQLFMNGEKQSDTGDSQTGTVHVNHVTIGYDDYSDYRSFSGEIDEVRFSNIVRPDAWIKATYYSNWNTLITYGSEQQRPIFLFNGYVKVSGIPASRTVYLYRRATGDLIESVVSDSATGYFEIGSYYNDYHFVVVLPELTEGYNLISYDQIHPGV